VERENDRGSLQRLRPLPDPDRVSEHAADDGLRRYLPRLHETHLPEVRQRAVSSLRKGSGTLGARGEAPRQTSKTSVEMLLTKEEIRKVLKEHWLTAIHCDHKDSTDRPGCYCGVWYCEPQPNVGAAIDKWIEHVLEQIPHEVRP
jgi:hypothetical protein